MSTDRDVTRIVRSWLEEGVTALPDRVLDNVLDLLPATPQRRSWWPTRRFPVMNNTIVRFGTAAAAVVIAAILVIRFLPGGNVGGDAEPTPTPVPTPTATPVPLLTGTLPAGTYVARPGAEPDWWSACPQPTTPGCSDPVGADSIRVTFTVPAGWTGFTSPAIGLTDKENLPPGGAALILGRGSWLHDDPCRNDALFPNVQVGPSVDDFANALADHPLLDVTTPVDVSLGGYSGKYLDLQVPSDLTGCTENYRPWEPGLFAQGPSHRWHLWILDFNGVRVVVQSMDYAGTSAQDQAELQAIVDSIQITP